MHQQKFTAARLKNDTAQWLRVANSARIFINLSWYDITMYILAEQRTPTQERCSHKG